MQEAKGEIMTKSKNIFKKFFIVFSEVVPTLPALFYQPKFK